ncbi:MAG: amino acid racemase [Thermomicrobium sp.]|nr:amino acid racemase [Thermomicrobium sp.]MDW7981442.1 amino acid racemase [Thermomicrobium sp.]
MGQPYRIGILGGMGPLATVDLYRKIIEATPAERDQDHLPVVIDAEPRIPDRTAALLGRGPDPTPWLIAGARRLEAAGADFLVVACNTAHAFLPVVQEHIAIPFVSMIAETAERLVALLSPGSLVGVLATEGTIASQLYQVALAERGLQVLIPDRERQNWLSRAIARVKAGTVDEEASTLVRAAAQWAIERGARALVLGCTELPLIMPEGTLPVPIVDPTRLLARAAVAIASGARELPAPLRSPTPHRRRTP